MSLDTQRVVIVGGTSGIGLATAHAVLDAGGQVVVASSRQSSIDAALNELPGATGQTLDVLDSQAVAAFFDTVGDFDHLVYTAGESLTLMPVADFDLATAESAFRIRFLEPSPPSAPPPRTSERAGPSPSPPVPRAPGPAPAGPRRGHLWWHNEPRESPRHRARPLRVNVVEPGIIRSPLWSGMSDDDQQAMFAQQAEVVPVGRVGEVTDVAQAFVYSMTQGFMTGTSIPVDGGALLV